MADPLQSQTRSHNNVNTHRTAIHPSRCSPLDMKFLWKLYHQRQHIDVLNNNNDNSTTSQTRERIQILEGQGFPVGLASTLLKHTHDFPIRVWLVDNSGTMHHNDGHIVTQTSEGKVEIVKCSRWHEICTALCWHAELAAWVQTPMAIRFLNDPGVHVGPQQLGVSASKHHNSNEEVAALKAMLHKIRPTGGTTPIHNHLQELVGPIEALLGELEQNQRKLVICVCTDSIPTDVDGTENPQMMENFFLTLQQFTEWPVHVVIRLLTGEERVVQFYQQLTRNDATLQVLDGYVNECRQVQSHNPWLHYGYPLHLCREQGIHSNVLETLAKRTLSPNELMEVLRIIFVGHKERPQDQVSFVHFRKEIETWNKEAGELWNPIKKRFVPWVDLKKLDKYYKERQQKQQRHWNKTGQHNNNEKCSLM